MKDVIKRIEQRAREFRKLSLFDFLRDEEVPPEQKLVFAPCMAHFIMTFGDLNKYILRVPGSTDPVQQIVNTYAGEDESHWELFLDDLEALEYDARMPFTDSLRSVWGDETARTRILSYKLCAIAYRNKPAANLAMIEAMEATAGVFFDLTLPIARELRRRRGVECRFFGDYHHDQEEDHAFKGGHGDPGHEALVLGDAEREHALHMVDDVFDAFVDFIDELWGYTQASLSKEPPASARFSRAPASARMPAMRHDGDSGLSEPPPASQARVVRAQRPLRSVRPTGT